MITCQERIEVDGRLVAYCGQPLTDEEAQELGLNAEGKFANAKKAPVEKESTIKKALKK